MTTEPADLDALEEATQYWDDFVDGVDEVRKAIAELRDLRDENYALKLAAAGDEDAPGSAALVTPAHVHRWRTERESEITRLREERDAAVEAIKPWARLKYEDVGPYSDRGDAASLNQVVNDLATLYARLTGEQTHA